MILEATIPLDSGIVIYRGMNDMSPNQNRNLSDRLIRIIETDAEELTRGTVEKLQTSTRTTSYRKLSYNELYQRAYTVYHNLGHWLWGTADQVIQAWYNELGEKRCEESVPLAEVLWALVLTKDRLNDYIGACAFADSALELYQLQEFDRLIGHFFDRAVCHTAEGYEHHTSVHGKAARRQWRVESVCRISCCTSLALRKHLIPYIPPPKSTVHRYTEVFEAPAISR